MNISKEAIERGRDLLVIALRGLIYGRMAQIGMTHADVAKRLGVAEKDVRRALMMGSSVMISAAVAIAWELGCHLHFALEDKPKSDAPAAEMEARDGQ